MWLSEQRKRCVDQSLAISQKSCLRPSDPPIKPLRFWARAPIGARRLTFRTHLLSLFLDPDWRDRVRYKKATVDIINFDPFPIYPLKYTIKPVFGGGQSHSLSFYLPSNLPIPPFTFVSPFVPPFDHSN